MTQQPAPLPQNHRAQYENYARAMGRENVEAMTDDELRGLMDYIARDCERWGCD